MRATDPVEATVKRKRSLRPNEILSDLSIGNKLRIGFGLLVIMTILLMFAAYMANSRARTSFETTRDERLPMAQAALEAESEMNDMLASIQGYLALQEQHYLDEFEDSQTVFHALIEEMNAHVMSESSMARHMTLNSKFEEWRNLLDQMIALQDESLAYQPATQLLSAEVRPAESALLQAVDVLIEQQSLRQHTRKNMELTQLFTEYRSSFRMMANALEGYLMTGEPIFREQYEEAAADNNEIWASMHDDNVSYAMEQAAALTQLSEARDNFLPLPEKMILVADSKPARGDLDMYNRQLAPLSTEILQILDEMQSDHIDLLVAEVNEGNARLATSQTQTIIGAILSVLTAVVLAAAIKRNIADPVVWLTGLTAEIMDGNLDARVYVTSRDEIGRLASSFNEMTSKLQGTLADAEHRARVIEASSQVSRRLSTILDQQQLVREVVDRLREAFDYYYVHIFLLDAKGEFLVTAGGVGQAGKELVERGFQIPINQGLVGRSATTNSLALATDVTMEKDFLPNSLLPDTRTEIAVPIAIGDEVLGVLDVQHTVVGSLGQTDADLLQSIASQVAIALLNARSYTETQRRANREILINTINQKLLETVTVEQALQVAIREIGRAVDAPLTTARLDSTDSVDERTKQWS